MRFLAIQRPLLAAVSGLSLASGATAAPHAGQLNALVQGWRYASVKAQGAYKKRNTKGIPKKLGAKRTGDQFVVPGNILYKQRGTLWWPGENCIMGRDHTIHAMATGFVKYYRDPNLHPDRKYIGVVFDKNDTLPYPQHAERKRRLNKTVHQINTLEPTPETSPSGIPFQVRRVEAGEPDRLLRLRDDYSYREDNWRIGRLVETKGPRVRKTRFRTRKQYFRHRRWVKERTLDGQRKADARRAELGEEAVVVKRKAQPMSKKAAKKAAKKKAK